jgi:hypothetical protein
MFQRLFVTAAVASLSVLGACTPGEQASQAGSAVVPQTRGAAPFGAVTPDKDCGGAGGVTVSPCPIRLTKHTKRGIVVTVSGPGVVSSDLGQITSCFSGKICYNAERRGNSQTEWRITSGQYCSAADVEFRGYNTSGALVGYFFLKVANKYCP